MAGEKVLQFSLRAILFTTLFLTAISMTSGTAGAQTTATMSVSYTAPTGYNYSTTITVSNGDGLYPYYLNMVFQNSTGSDIFTQTQYTSNSTATFSWTYAHPQLQPGKNYTVKALVIDSAGKYLATTNLAPLSVQVQTTTTSVATVATTLPTTLPTTTQGPTTTLQQSGTTSLGAPLLLGVVVVIIVIAVAAYFLTRKKAVAA